jgi:secondary thiamine-phosphate synthase enzyme
MANAAVAVMSRASHGLASNCFIGALLFAVRGDRYAGRIANARSSMNFTVKLSVGGQGLYDITHKVTDAVAGSPASEGLVTVFIRHTSASLVIQENADPSVRRDLETWLNRLVPENDPLYTHTIEGPDDMPAHIKGALTASSLSIPLIDGRLALGTWQGIFLWEHRHTRGDREVVVNVMGAPAGPPSSADGRPGRE